MPLRGQLTRRSFLRTSAAAGAATVATAAPVPALAVDMPVLPLIEAHKAAYAAFNAALDNSFDGDGPDVDRTSGEEDASLCHLLAHCPVSPADALAKLAYLGPMNAKGQIGHGAQHHTDCLLASLMPGDEFLPPEWRGWSVEYVETGDEA